MTSQFADIATSLILFIFPCFVVKFSYWSKFHANIITASGVMTILVYKGLTRNLKSKIPPSGFYQISGGWGKLGLPTFEQMSLLTCLYYLRKTNRVGGGGVTYPD